MTKNIWRGFQTGIRVPLTLNKFDTFGRFFPQLFCATFNKVKETYMIVGYFLVLKIFTSKSNLNHAG